MTTWTEVSKKIVLQNEDSQSVISDKLHLQNIFCKAEIWGIPADVVEKAGLSNLRAIVPLASKAIYERDRARLEELLNWASRMTNTQLRIALQTYDRDRIEVEVQGEPGIDPDEVVFVLRLTREQLVKLARTSQRQASFTVNGKDILDNK